MPKPLTEKQELFAQFYAVSGNAKESAIRAGYSPKTAYNIGHRLTRNESVIARLEELKPQLSAAASVTAEQVIERLWLEAHGVDVPNTTQAARVRALELVGKHIGMWTDSDDEVTAGSVDVRGVLKIEREIIHREVTDDDRRRR